MNVNSTGADVSKWATTRANEPRDDASRNEGQDKGNEGEKQRRPLNDDLSVPVPHAKDDTAMAAVWVFEQPTWANEASYPLSQLGSNVLIPPERSPRDAAPAHAAQSLLELAFCAL